MVDQDIPRADPGPVLEHCDRSHALNRIVPHLVFPRLPKDQRRILLLDVRHLLSLGEVEEVGADPGRLPVMGREAPESGVLEARLDILRLDAGLKSSARNKDSPRVRSIARAQK